MNIESNGRIQIATNSVNYWVVHMLGQATLWHGGFVFAIKENDGEMIAVLMLRPPGSIQNGVSMPNMTINLGLTILHYAGDKTMFLAGIFFSRWTRY